MNIIIVGCGKVGSTLAKQLSKEGHDISIIDINDKVVEEFSNSHDVMGIVGNGAAYSIQKSAGIEKAHLLIAVTGSDELNLLCCLIARKAGNCETIAKVRNPIYYKEIGFIKEELGLSMVINPDYEAASEIARILRFPSAIDINVFNKGSVELLSFKLEKGSILHDMKVQEIRAKLKFDILVCMVERGEEVIIPNGEFIMKENDIISIIAPHKKATEFFVKIGMIKNPVKNSMLIGGGDISYYLAKRLIKYGIDVTLVEKDEKRCEELSELIPEAMIIHGDGTDKDLLMEEGITHAESFASLTGLDEQNVLLSLHASNNMNGKIITKVNRITFDEVINNLNLGSIIYPKFTTMRYILKYVRAMNNSIGSNVETLYKIKNDKAEALEFYVNENSKLVGIPLEKLKLKDNLIICYIKRKGEIITPNGQDCIKKGDYVIVVTTNVGLQDLSDILRS
ncbi:MAG TPA: Trk system potassium transporter TrkA [Romboutsia timonensis]|uniref:Trk system potassium uptake protein TrkA n=1 Tax=Romboutsia timonensis TaxID=1776391 RepID=A0A921N0W9_9FIRM|nr:Trk system potassium transporter TrkA [uncultured Romboutsia sp.]HJG96917.1 Trk system potassium transporter TrkA [Romboutsia timonensis]